MERPSDGTAHTVLILVIVFVLCAFKSAGIWDNKRGNAYYGFLIGAIFGPLGLLYCYVATPSRKSY
jgi:uncharacterized membrane protein (DUF2068 family)